MDAHDDTLGWHRLRCTFCLSCIMLWQVRACQALYRGGTAGGEEGHWGGQQQSDAAPCGEAGWGCRRADRASAGPHWQRSQGFSPGCASFSLLGYCPRVLRHTEWRFSKTETTLHPAICFTRIRQPVACRAFSLSQAQLCPSGLIETVLL